MDRAERGVSYNIFGHEESHTLVSECDAKVGIYVWEAQMLTYRSPSKKELDLLGIDPSKGSERIPDYSKLPLLDCIDWDGDGSKIMRIYPKIADK